MHVIHNLIMHYYLRKIFIVVFLLVSFSCRVSAPDRKSFNILDSDPVQPYKKLIKATGMVESKGDTLAYNPIEMAAGFFQIRPIRLLDYNKRTGSKYTMKDMFSYEISEKIFLYYASKIGPYNFEQIARSWNGSGHHTNSYWKQIKQLL